MNEQDKLKSLGELSSELKEMNNINKESKKKSKFSSSLNVCSDLVSGMMVGGIIGYYLDKYFDTKPFIFIISFVLGNIASGMLIYRNFKK